MKLGGIIGYGGMGRNHGITIPKPSGFSYIAAYDVDPVRSSLAKQDGLCACASLEELLSMKELDTILVAVPNQLHEELTIAALEAGKNVICEKPAALSTVQWGRMVACAARCGRLLTVHQNRRWDQDYRIVEAAVKSGELGKLFRVESRVQGARGIAPTWRRYAAYGGGMMYDWGVHLIDQLLQLMDKPLQAVQCEFQYLTQTEVDENFRLNLYFEGGFSALVEIGTSNFQMLPRWYVCGERGTTLIPYWDCKGETICSNGLDIPWEEEIATASVMGPSRTLQPRGENTIDHLPLPAPAPRSRTFYENWLDAIEGRDVPMVTLGQVTQALRVMELAFESGRVGQILQFVDL
ncbi:MAG: Gfo/Idh/MocA family oxidoreductase [Eubacteriales bacterium]|nr:Gfo/Idh/MocA family oxidoreductase [Eubacteriales bacterium]